MPRIPTTAPKIPTVQNKLKILAAIITFVVIVVFMFESVVVVEAGHEQLFCMWAQLNTVYYEKEYISSFHLLNR